MKVEESLNVTFDESHPPSKTSPLKDDELVEEEAIEVQFRRTSLTGFPAQSIRSSNAIALDSSYLLVLITGTSQSRQYDKSESDSYYLSD
ncbi:hypothetical protein Tco_0947478 [Tanacetum coccineum]